MRTPHRQLGVCVEQMEECNVLKNFGADEVVLSTSVLLEGYRIETSGGHYTPPPVLHRVHVDS